jgi:hypothetical protein
MGNETLSYEQAATACGLTADWLAHSSWNLARAFHSGRFQLETIALDRALDFHCCWHTTRCARFSSGQVTQDGGGKPIAPLDPGRLLRPVAVLACSVRLVLQKRPEKFRPFESVLHDPSALMAMDANHRLAGLHLRRQQGFPDLVSEVNVYVSR